MKIIDGKKLAEEICVELSSEVSQLKLSSIFPRLVIVGINPDTRSQIYIRGKLKKASEIGIEADFFEIADKSKVEQQNFIKSISTDPKVHGVILQLPLFGYPDPQELLDLISPNCDVDGLCTTSQNKLENGEQGFVPATPLAVMEILNRNQIELIGQKVCVIGRSKLVGHPLALLLRQAGAEVTVGHREIEDLSELTLDSDVVISAAGSAGLVDGSMIKNGAVVIDVGINEINGRLFGDVDFDSVVLKASLITPVPGGVGPMTIAMLLRNVVTSAKS